MRRAIIALLLCWASVASARVAFFSGAVPVDISPSYYLDGHISYGQSWRSNDFSSFTGFGFNPEVGALIAMHYTNSQVKTLQGPLPTSAGISLPGDVDGTTGYGGTDNFSIGRTAIAAQQILRANRIGALTKILEVCFAYPGSTWASGGGGGLAPGASFTASVTSDVMTVTGSPVGAVVKNQNVTAAGLNAATTVVGPAGTGTGGAGTYNLAVGQIFLAKQLVMTHATVVGFISGESANAGNVFTVSSVVSGTVTVGDTVPTPALAGTVIISQRDGAAGGIGNYIVRVGAAQSVGSEAMTSTGTSWKNQAFAIGQFQGVLPQGKILGIHWSSVGYTQGGSQPLATGAEKVANLTEMLTDYDALNLPGAGTTGMRYYLGQPSAISNATSLDDSIGGTYTFTRANAPGMGGTWSGRAFATSPSYAWPFNGADNIHTGDYGTARWGENEGYVRFLVQDMGVAWTPLWRPLTGGAITVVGQTITIPFARPTGPDFTTAPLVMQSAATDGIKVWPNNGFNVRRGGSFLTISSVAIAGMNVVLTLSGSPLSPGDVLEISYAWYGPGGPNPGISSGVGGNLLMNGPASVLFPGNTIDAWAWPFLETITL